MSPAPTSPAPAPAVRICLADPAIRAEQVDAIARTLPPTWQLTHDPQDAAAILTENAAVTPAMIAAAGASLRLLLRLDTGHAPVPANLPVPVIDLPNTALVGVAEHTILLMLALSRNLLDVLARTRRAEWLPDRSTPVLTDQRKYTYNWIGVQNFGVLYRKTLGIVGLGLIGRAVAARARAFGMRVLYTQRHRLDPSLEAHLGVTFATLADLLAASDFVSLHHRFDDGSGGPAPGPAPSAPGPAPTAPGPDPTAVGSAPTAPGNDRQFGAAEFARMKPTACLINTARGRLVDEDALAAALRRGQIAGAGLDVFRYEPLPPDHPFFALPPDRLLLTPHVAGAPLAEAWQTIAEELVERVQAALGGRETHVPPTIRN
jgi:glyoxylate reductase